jgi:hypothetical protein
LSSGTLAQALQLVSGNRQAKGENTMENPSSTGQFSEDLAIVTCSYGPDWHRCARLCASVDRYVPAHVEHLLIVPARDVSRFAGLAGGRRRVLTVESVVPGHFRQLPVSNRWWIDARGWPVRGWVMQQVTKLSANRATDAEVILFADSDLQFLRPLERDDLFRDDRLRLHRIPGAKRDGEHLQWHHRAAALLGTAPGYFGADYVGQLISWRRSHLTGLQAHIEKVQGQPWYRGIARSLRVSEYILYGAYIEGILGLEHSGHFGTADDLCHCCWFAEDVTALTTGAQSLRTDALALLLQSNLGLSDSQELAIAQRAVANHGDTVNGDLQHA